MDVTEVTIETAERGEVPFRLVWDEIMWEGNAAGYLVAIPVVGGGSDPGEVEELKRQLEEFQEMAAAEAIELRARLEEKEGSQAHELEELRAKLAETQESAASEIDELTARLERSRELSESMEGADTATLRRELEQSVEMAAVEADKRQAAEQERQKLQAKLRDLHQRSLSKLEAARDALEKERTERNELSARLAQLKQETDRLREQLEAKTDEVETVRHQSGEHFESLKSELLLKTQAHADVEEELQRLRNRVEELEIELVATSAGLASAESTLGTTTTLENKLVSLEGVVEELRFRRDLDYREVEGTLRRLQERYADIQVNGVSIGELDTSDLEKELTELRSELESLRQERKADREKLASVPVMTERIELLEEALQEALEAQEESDDTNFLIQVRKLEAELAQAREEIDTVRQEAENSVQLARREAEQELARTRHDTASAEELNRSRARIAELEMMVAGLNTAGETTTSSNEKELQAELQRAREQLEEMSRELRRTLEGDRETKKLAYADQLTGLPNLNLTGQYLQVCYERSTRNEGALALMLIDLDHFRRVNDALGQKAGDDLLRQVGARLQRSVTEKDTAIARRGEDEFMVVAFMEGARSDGEALMARVRGIAHNLLNELAKPFDILGQRVQVTASLGVALFPGPAESCPALFEQAEHAMYQAKEAGRARVLFYTEEMHSIRERRRNLESELHQAHSQGQIGVVFQPIYEIASKKVAGVEALMRWSHPHRGILEPEEFLEAAEESGLIIPIGDAVIRDALEVTKQRFMKKKFVSLNLNFRQLIDSGFSARFMKHVQLTGAKPHEVIVEVSEKTVGLDPDRIRKTLDSLAHWGVGIAFEDFGGGGSTLSHLTEFSLRVLKIDAGLIKQIPDNRATTNLCRAIAQMANSLNIPVVAEGVDTREQLEVIASIGCQYVQGDILSPPVPLSQLGQVI